MNEFDGLCRLCLKPSEENMVNVSNFDDLIALIAKVKLVKHPKIPHKICKNCSTILIAAGMMRVNCIESNKYFMSYLEEKNEKLLTSDELENWEIELEIAEMPKKDVEEEYEDVEHEEKFQVEDNVKEEIVVKVNPKPAATSENCRLCLTTFRSLPEENAVYLLKDMIRQVLVLKKFTSLIQKVPDKLCDDCLGKLITASAVAEKCTAAYDYFHSKESVTLTSATCWVCLHAFESETDICDMSTMTYSYMHYLAIKNSMEQHPEIHGERRICLTCRHDLEVTNQIRHKNWKTERALDVKYGFKAVQKKVMNPQKYDPWYVEDDDDDCKKEVSNLRPLNASSAAAQNVDCQFCLKQFQSEVLLRRHIDQDHIPVATDCSECGTKLANERGFRVHYLTVHLKKVEAICDVCGRVYYSLNKLAKHRVIHFDERNVPCTLCSATFKRKENLKIHMRVHSGAKPFKCQYCDKKYAHHSDCKRHMVSHTGKYPITCSCCGQGFIKKSELLAHQERHARPNENE